jgi:hypothetical protein
MTEGLKNFAIEPFGAAFHRENNQNVGPFDCDLNGKPDLQTKI